MSVKRPYIWLYELPLVGNVTSTTIIMKQSEILQ